MTVLLHNTCLCTCWENYLLVDTFDYRLLLLISLHYFNVQSGALLVTVFGLPNTVWRSWSWGARSWSWCWPKRLGLGLGLGKFLKTWSWSCSWNKSLGLGLGLEKKVLFTSLVAAGQNLPFSIDFDRHPYSTFALPRECVMISERVNYQLNDQVLLLPRDWSSVAQPRG